MDHPPLVSVIINFLNGERFIQETIDSVLTQTYQNWELLLVDDGSSDASTDMAQHYAAQNPEKIFYLTHPNQQNKGSSASRNLGIRKAKGEYVAFLDADDIWLPSKLERQVTLLESQPKAAMLYGRTEYWYSWTGESQDRSRDYIQAHGIAADILYQPPTLLSLYLQGKAAVPCTCSLLVRRTALKQIGGFEDTFRDLYDDQVFYAKLGLKNPVFVASECLDRYRQHPDSMCATAEKSKAPYTVRWLYLNWLADYLSEQKINDSDLWQTLRRELWVQNHLAWPYLPKHLSSLIRRAKKYLLKLEHLILPATVRRWLWS